MKFEEGSETSFLYFKGDQTNNNYLKIDRQPSFFDALQLIKPKPTKPYQRIPLSKNTSHIFHHNENFVKKFVHYEFDLKNNSIYIKDTDKQSEHHFLSFFLIKEERRVTYMAHRPKSSKKATTPTYIEYKKLEES